jgi:hypothetical protein
LEIHGTHFASKDDMKFLLANRDRMTEKFALKFGHLRNHDYMKQAAEMLCIGARIWDLWGQLLPPDYFQRLPLLILEMNAATAPDESPQGDLIIGKTPHEQIEKLSGFVEHVALDEPTIKVARRLLGSNNSYEQGLRKLVISNQKIA